MNAHHGDQKPAWFRRTWHAFKAVIQWFRVSVLMHEREVPTIWAGRHLHGLRRTAAVLGGLAMVIAGIGWFNWRAARARALGLLIERQEARGVIAVKAYERGRAQIREVTARVEQDPAIPPEEKIRVKGDLAVLMIWVVSREQASVRAIQAAHDARATIPSAVSDRTMISDPISGMRFPLGATKDEMVGPMTKTLQEGEQTKTFLNLIAAYSRPGAPTMPTQTEAASIGLQTQGGVP